MALLRCLPSFAFLLIIVSIFSAIAVGFAAMGGHWGDSGRAIGVIAGVSLVSAVIIALNAATDRSNRAEFNRTVVLVMKSEQSLMKWVAREFDAVIDARLRMPEIGK
jgi:hypothetical protein